MKMYPNDLIMHIVSEWMGKLYVKEVYSLGPEVSNLWPEA